MPGSSPVLERAQAQALRLIKFRPRSEAELRKRLALKGFSGLTVEGLLADLKAKGLIDDAKFARYFAAREMLLKPSGRRGLMAALRARGISDDQAAEAFREAAGGEGEEETARRVALKRLGAMKGVSKEALTRRLFGFLGRRGFSSDTVYRVVKEVTASKPSSSGLTGGSDSRFRGNDERE
ncbi:MAG: regulatory protein RecX [Candidatus Omnitrophica bacterium]|nr:regulatory protein RecX [Candidatus Omnitrophota bacterium]